MRKSAMLDVLFPRIRQGVLEATVVQPEKWWFLSELAEFIGTAPSSLQREIAALVKTGILEQRKEGRRTYVKAQTRSPIYRELRGLIEKTAGVIPTIRMTLEPFADKIACAFVFGSVASATEHAASDVDLMVIGNLGLADLVPNLKKAERSLGRELNVTNYSISEFRAKVQKKDHFLTSVMRRPKQFVKGNQRELVRLSRA
jgi:predicted nucleotidyltransferase